MSLWWSLVDRPTFSPSELNQHWDVIIVGGGFSGLWTAHHLIESNPKLRIAILEKDQVGSGASGRNGGWASALFPTPNKRLLRNFSVSAVEDLHTHLRSAIDEIGSFIKQENIECGFHKGGNLSIARNKAQLIRLHSHADERMEFLNAQETRNRIGITDALGALYTQDCASLNPAALVVGLALSLARRGVAIFENTLAEFTDSRKVRANGVGIEADFALRAIEAYHANSRDQIPIYSLMIATEPLPTEVIDKIGIRNHETFSDESHVRNYAQRTSDNRLAIGGRGAPYTWGSRRNDRNEAHRRIHKTLRAMAREWFPVLENHSFTHSWGGAVGITRDWAPYVRANNSYGEMGGYAGDGVTLSYLAAGAMADLITHRESTRSRLPFVQWQNPLWEKEPLRWIAINTAVKLTGLADKEERITQRPSLIMKTIAPIIGQ